MVYKLYRLSFRTGVHIGKRNLSETETSMCADTLYSAMCHEFLKMGKEKLEGFIEKTMNGKISFSDALPYIRDTYYIPKPIMKIEVETKRGDSTIKKAYKKLSYIPCDKLEEYMQGKLEIKQEEDKFANNLGELDIRTKVSLSDEEPVPYRVASYHFKDESGLYVLVAFEDEGDINIIDECFTSLGMVGIGGKRKSGLGRFTWSEGVIPQELQKRLLSSGRRYMSLSACLPADDELESVLSDSNYMLIKRSGFIASSNYADELRRKKDLYVLQAGSCFGQQFKGSIVDVSEGGSHPVYRYARPFLMEVIS